MEAEGQGRGMEDKNGAARLLDVLYRFLVSHRLFDQI